MTIKKIIERVDRSKPNAFSEEDKLRWVSELDGLLGLEVMLMDIVEVQQLAYSYPEDLDTVPLVKFPHDGIYDHWLYAKIDYENGEYDKYYNSMEQYNALRESFVNWFVSTYEPAQGYGRERMTDGIS